MRFTHTWFFRAWKIYAPLARHRCIATQYFISHVLPWLKKDFMYTAPNPKPPMKSFLLKDSRATSDSLKSSRDRQWKEMMAVSEIWFWHSTGAVPGLLPPRPLIGNPDDSCRCWVVKAKKMIFFPISECFNRCYHVHGNILVRPEYGDISCKDLPYQPPDWPALSVLSLKIYV